MRTSSSASTGWGLGGLGRLKAGKTRPAHPARRAEAVARDGAGFGAPRPPLPPPLDDFVPRKPGVTDGAWDSIDAEAVREAQMDADARAAAWRTAPVGDGAAAAAAAAANPSAVDPARRESPPPGKAPPSGDTPAHQPLSRRAQSDLRRSRVVLAHSTAHLSAVVTAMGEPSFRGKQLRDAVFGGGAKARAKAASAGPSAAPPRRARSIHDVVGVPARLREALVDDGWTTGRSHLHSELASPCGTRKFLLQAGGVDAIVHMVHPSTWTLSRRRSMRRSVRAIHDIHPPSHP